MPPERIPYFLVARCKECGRLFTSYQLVRRWEKAEAAGVNTSACPCGGNRFSPTNAKWWEEILNINLWEVIWKDALLPWWREKVEQWNRPV